MSDQKEFLEARAWLTDEIERELLGPGSERIGLEDETEIITDSPKNRYSVGMLFPQGEKRTFEDEVDDTGDNSVTQSGSGDFDDELDRHINLANEFYPSAMGFSFNIEQDASFSVQVKAATYRSTDLEDCRVEVGDCRDFLELSEKFDDYFSWEDGYLELEQDLDYDELEEIKKQFEIKFNDRFPDLTDRLEASGALWGDATAGRYIYFNSCDRDELIDKGVSPENAETVHSFWKLGWGMGKLVNQNRNGYKREPLDLPPIEFHASQGAVSDPSDILSEGLDLRFITREQNRSANNLCTLSLINTHESSDRKYDTRNIFCQVKLIISAVDDGNTPFLPYPESEFQTDDEEQRSLDLLYRDRQKYALGHGTSVDWSMEDNDGEIFTEFLPSHEVVSRPIFEVEALEEKSLSILEMKQLSDIGTLSDEEMFSQLRTMVDLYDDWIDSREADIEQIEEKHKQAARRHVENLREVSERIKGGIDLLESDPEILRSFKLANRAMLMQRLHSEMIESNRYPEDSEPDWPDYHDHDSEDASWRPFQLAFSLMTLKSTADPECDERDTVDFIWFPTGGGKTEAYLGLSAFTLFLRRLRAPECGGGTAIIMRYTLRLLTSQQFQRASTLICACEAIRSEMSNELGSERFTIGLWIGGSSTPNKLQSAYDSLEHLTAARSEENPFQLLTCPWCGTHMTKEDGKGRWGYKKESDPKRISLFCPESSCKFSLEQSGELPVRVVDEELYSNAPTLLFGTVDKFAQIPWREEVSTFFGLDSDNLNPELIIQDELHLISGPLGSIVGMYEMLLDEMCSADGISPKIISSTATSRRAGEQCAALYNRDVQQFPPPGLEASDSFFFREEDVDEIPGRLYLGIMSSCKTQTTTEIRAMGRLLQSIGNMDAPDEVKDHFWTLVNYFNSLRELGHCVTLLNDDIRSFIRALQNREGKPGRKLTDHLELTSRVDSEDIPDHLSQLEVPYDSDNPHAASDVALASNMISVGLDVSRLGLMTVIGQPKTTSEYIQATSRVGRDHPGLVVTLFDGARSRDRSHYEHFKDYHQAFYRYVEPSSVTPFSRSVRERALQSVVISLVRHFQGLEDNQKASEINQTDIDFEEIESTIMDRVKEVSKKRGIPLTEEDRKKIASEIDDIFTHWQNLANEHEELVYRDWSDFRGGRKSNPPLLTMRGKDNPIVEDHDAPVDSFEALLSMRNVDVGTKIRILE